MKQITYAIICVLLGYQSISQVVTDHRTPPRDMTSSLTRPQFESMPVYRIQLMLITGKTNDAGTDNPVYVQMNNGGEKFYLVQGIDNFMEGSTVFYDVFIDDIKKVKDIDFIRFGITGDDGLCIKRIDVLFNNCNSPVYSKVYDGERGTCFDNGSSAQTTMVITRAQLRGASGWNYNDDRRKDMWRPPLSITKLWMTSIVEATIGNQIYQEGGSLKWGTVGGTLENKTLFGAAVDVERVDNHTLHFDLDLERDVNGPNPELDVDFDLEFKCKDGRIVTEVKNVKADTDTWGEIRNVLAPLVAKLVGKAIGFVVGGIIGGPGGAAVATAAGAYATGKLAEALKFDVKFDVSNPTTSQSCKKAVVDVNGNIILR